MTHWPARHLLAMFLAVFVTVGIGVSAVQASGMAAEMAMAAGMDASEMDAPDMDAATHDGCPACPRDGDDGGKATPCVVACAAPVVAVLPQAATIAVAHPLRPTPALDPPLHGRSPPPDPYPPRPTDIG